MSGFIVQLIECLLSIRETMASRICTKHGRSHMPEIPAALREEKLEYQSLAFKGILGL